MNWIRTLFLILVLKPSVGQVFDNNDNDWAWKELGVTENFKKLVGKKKIEVAVIDDAFQLENPRILPFLKYNLAEIPGNNIDDDKNGKVDDYTGWDFSDNDANVNPPSGQLRRFSHGTKVTGILIEGLNKILSNPTEIVKILPLKSSSDFRNNNYITDGYEAIKYAIEQKVDIIICCWSGGVFDKEKEEILKKAQDDGIIIIASSGNFVAEKEQFPAAFSWSINTAALSKGLGKQLISNYGRFVDLALPGDSIFTISPIQDHTNDFLSATSAATAILGGIVTSIYAAFPEIQPSECDRILKNACRPLEKANPLYKGKLGAGILDINRLILNLQNGENNSRLSIPKGYIKLSNMSTKVLSGAKYPSFKIINSVPHIKSKGNIYIRKWLNSQINDTTLTMMTLNTPLFLQADSFLVNTTKKLNQKEKFYIYFEAQAIDSSILYCSETLNFKAPFGIISDGSGTENYANNSNCKWQIEVASNKRIKIVFEEMDIESKVDQVYIFSDFGTESTILAIFSGQNIPPEITSWSNRAMIWFVSNGSINLKGWSLKYEEVD